MAVSMPTSTPYSTTFNNGDIESYGYLLMILEHPLAYILAGIIVGLLVKPLKQFASRFFHASNVITKAQIKAINSSLTDGFVIIDQLGQVIYVNQAILDLFDYDDEQQLLGQNITVLMTSNQSSVHDQYLDKYIKTGIRKFLGTDRRVTAQKQDGSEMHISLSINEIEVDSTPYFAAFIRDISKEVEMHQQVEYQRNKFQTLYNYCPDGILYVSSNLSVIDANERFLSLCGDSLDNIKGQSITNLFTVDTPHLRHVKKLLHNTDEHWGQNEILAKLNNCLSRKIIVLITSQIIPGDNEQLCTHIYMFRDISKELDLIAHTSERNQTLELSEALVNIGYWRYNVLQRQLWCSEQIFKTLNMPFNNNHIIDIENIYTLIDPQDQQNAIDAIQQCFSHQLPLALSCKLTLDNNEDRHIILKGVCEAPTGSLTAIYGVIQDISDRIGQEESLRLTKERLERSQLFSNIGNWEWDIDSGQVFWSELAAPMFGDEEKSITTDFNHFVNSIHPDDQQSVSAAITRCIEHIEKYNIEHRVIWPDKSIHWLHEQGDVVRDVNGVATSMVGVVQDITERKAKETQLELFKQIIESSNQAIRISAEDNQLVYSNPAHQQLFLHNQDDVSHRFDDFLSNEFRSSGISQQIEQSLSQRDHWSGEIESKRTDGSLFPAHMSLSQFNDQQNKHQYRIGFCYDASDEIAQKAKLHQAKLDAESANRAKSEFLSSMSHELRTPLNAVLGFSQLLLRQKQVPFTERITDNIQTIYKAGEHLLTLINGILELAKIESGKSLPNFERVNIKEIIDEAITLVIPQVVEKRLSLQTPEGSKVPVLYTQRKIPLVDADFTVLKQALLNYLSNAIKYNKEDGIIFITVDINPDNKTTRITICDNGIGISSESIDDLFTPFNRLGLETSNIQGTGIGLAITKKNIESIGGSVGVKSKLGSGSNFWIDLPYIELLDDNQHSSPNDSIISKALSNLSSNDLLVLYIEDNPSNTQLMISYFDSIKSAKLITAVNAELGVVLANEYLPKVLLLDLNLPGMDGFAALATMKSNDQLKDSIFIAVTADVMNTTREKVDQAGFDAFLSKPISFDALNQLLSQYSQTHSPSIPVPPTQAEALTDKK